MLTTTSAPPTTNLLYRVSLRVTDSAGLQGAATAEVRPRVVAMNLATVPSGLQVTLDGQPFTAPASAPLVAGMVRAVGAPSPQVAGGSNYAFVLWSDGGAADHTVTVPLTNAGLTASFVQPALELGRAGSDLLLSWPAWAGAMLLLSATNLTPPVAWRGVTNRPQDSNGVLVLRAAPLEMEAFYRLYRP